MGFTRKLALGAVVAGAALAYHVRQCHARTGESYVTVVKRLPSDVRRVVEETRQRAAVALEEGRQAARARESAIAAQLEAAEPPEPPAGRAS